MWDGVGYGYVVQLLYDYLGWQNLTLVCFGHFLHILYLRKEANKVKTLFVSLKGHLLLLNDVITTK